MPLGYGIRKKVMAYQKKKAREEASLYGVSAEKSDAYFDKRQKEGYILKQQEQRAAEERAIRQDAKAGGFKGRLKAGLKSTSKKIKQHQRNTKRSNMGLGSINLGGGSGPQFGLSSKPDHGLRSSNATDITVKRKKGPFDL